MTEMIERVAKAMAANDSGPEGSRLFDIHWGEFGGGYMESARAAIEAMREPTDGMVLLGMLAGEGPEFADPDETWRTMIGFILKES